MTPAELLARINDLEEALENYEDEIRQHIAVEFPNSPVLPKGLHDAITKGRAALAKRAEDGA